jgi:F-type H+-transporting ATPase subunit delta
VLTQNPEIIEIIDNPKISKSRLTQLLLDITQGYLTREGENLLKLLVQNNRLILAPQISDLYEMHKAQTEGYIDVDVKTAYPFTELEAQSFRLSLEKRWAKTVRMSVSVDESLIGGFRVKAGDQVIDGSIKGQLQQLAKRL